VKTARYCRLNSTKSGSPWWYSGVLATGAKDRGFEPGLGDGFLRAIKVRSKLSFGREVKPKVPCRKILRHVKDLLRSHGDE
jgi:hypothetical protein